MTLHEWLKDKNTKDFAEQIGVNHSTVWRWRIGEVTPSMKTLLRIKEITNDAVRPEDWYV